MLDQTALPRGSRDGPPRSSCVAVWQTGVICPRPPRQLLFLLHGLVDTPSPPSHAGHVDIMKLLEQDDISRLQTPGEATLQIKHILESMLPDGTADGYVILLAGDNGTIDYVGREQSTAISWDSCPAWPPDVFAVVGTIVEKSGCYTHAGPAPADIEAHRQYLAKVSKVALGWTDTKSLPSELEELWSSLVAFATTELYGINDNKALVDVLLLLFAISDEACRGMGWRAATPTTTNTTEAGVYKFDDLVIASLSLASSQADKSKASLPYMPVSLCSLVAPDIAVVMPKSMTSSVGCTIRSLSHHLALLPGTTQIKPSWHLVDRSEAGTADAERLNLLLIPFPFHIPQSSFTLGSEPQWLQDPATGAEPEKTAGFFRLNQLWLKNGKHDLEAAEFVRHLIAPLINQAERDSEENVHGVILPECALSASLAEEVAEILASHGVEFFITGVLKEDRETTRNVAQTHVLVKDGNAIAHIAYEHAKHHRWRLDKTQASRYGLNFPEKSTLEPRLRGRQWWEEINVSERCLPFYAIRKDMSLSVLICEDLARSDPAMPVIRAVGPTLVVSLLMDGAQLAHRWPARYATVLADDPGSAVLTLTCAAMVDRSNRLESLPVRSIGLWRDSGGRTQELNLPDRSHGLLLCLKAKSLNQHTLDSRTDGSSTKTLSLESAMPLSLAVVPSWL